MSQPTDIYQKINEGYYKTKVSYSSKKKDAQQHKLYSEDSRRLEEEFKKDALQYVGLGDHPKAEKAYAMAWDYGHSAGHSEVMNYLVDLAELVL